MGKIGKKLIGTGWKDQPISKGLPACVSVADSLVPVGLSNQYQWIPKAPGENPGVLDWGQWSRFRGTGYKIGAYAPLQPVLKACFLVVHDYSVASSCIVQGYSIQADSYDISFVDWEILDLNLENGSSVQI